METVTIDLLPAESGMHFDHYQASLFASFPNILIVPTEHDESDPIEIDSVGVHKCRECATKFWVTYPYTVPKIASDGETWFYPCHESECESCGNVGDKDYFYGDVCDNCYVPRPRREYHDDCDCSLCRRNRDYSHLPAPLWVSDGIVVSDASLIAGTILVDNVQTDAGNTPVGQLMAEFYLCEFASASVAMHRGFGLTTANDGFRDAWHVRNDAMRYQSHIVATLDSLFRDYLLMAIGGEARHYYANDGTPHGRESVWNWFAGLALQEGREYAIEAAQTMFATRGGWASGYGGEAWRNIATVLLARERNEIDARTFVDRVFSLQHNGGCVLNKVAWHGGTGHIQYVGDAHAADIPQLAYLKKKASESFVRDLFIGTRNDGTFTYRLPTSYVHAIYRDTYCAAVTCAADNYGIDVSDSYYRTTAYLIGTGDSDRWLEHDALTNSWHNTYGGF